MGVTIEFFAIQHQRIQSSNVPVFIDGHTIDTHCTVLRRGLGGNAIRLDRINPGRRVTLNLNPGSADSAYINGLFQSKANIELTYTQIGTLDAAVGTEGVIVNDGPRGRGGQTITDDQWIFEFNSWTASKGPAS